MVHLRLLDFRTGNPHPLAMKPTLPIMTLDAFDIGLQVQAEVLGHGESILMQMSTGTGQAWNAHDSAFCQWYLTEWKTGRTIRVRTPQNYKNPKQKKTVDICLRADPNRAAVLLRPEFRSRGARYHRGAPATPAHARPLPRPARR